MKVSDQIRHLVPYKPGKPISETQREFGLSRVIKLASNENPLGPSPKAVAAIQRHLVDLHRYPDPAGYALIQRLSVKWNVPMEHMALGNGSNEIIDLLIRIFCEPGEKILTTEKAFLAYAICAQAARVDSVQVPTLPDLRIDMKGLAQAVLRDEKIRLVFIPNPNNPTGTYVTKTEIANFLTAIKGRENLLVVFDEAYTEFVRASDYASGLEWMKENPSVVVLRTFSKVYGLAGLRLGAMIASREVIDLYHRVRNPFNTNELAQVAALAAIDDEEFLSQAQQVVWQGLEQVEKGLTNLKLPFLPSQGNFLLFDTLRPAQAVYEALLRKGFILRPVGNYGLPRHLRWTVGLPEENKTALEALAEVLQQIPSSQ